MQRHMQAKRKSKYSMKVNQYPSMRNSHSINRKFQTVFLSKLTLKKETSLWRCIMYRYCYHEVTPEVARLYKEKKKPT